jgi:hypothetical protein
MLLPAFLGELFISISSSFFGIALAWLSSFHPLISTTWIFVCDLKLCLPTRKVKRLGDRKTMSPVSQVCLREGLKLFLFTMLNFKWPWRTRTNSIRIIKWRLGLSYVNDTSMTQLEPYHEYWKYKQ